MKTLRDNLHLLELIRDEESLSIFFDRGENWDILPICYWHVDEWIEDSEMVVPAMLRAMELYYTNKEQLLIVLGFDLESSLF